MNRRGQRGMSLVVAIFLVVIVASLAAFAVASAGATRNTKDLQLLSGRALAAARAGAEWGAYRALSQNTCPTAAQPLTLNQGALRGFSLSVLCVRSRPEGTYWVVDITSTATWSRFGAPDYAYRRVVTRYDQP
jgi:MSHA biogenesis protein MshP